MSQLTRREFLKLVNRLAVATGLTALVAPVVAFFYPAELEETPSDPVSAGPLSELPPGAAKTISFGRYPALVVHTPSGLRAYSAVCTHFACIVKWDPAANQIVCPCHDGFFAVEDGQVLAGPPPSPLEPIPVAVVDDEIFVGGNA